MRVLSTKFGGHFKIVNIEFNCQYRIVNICTLTISNIRMHLSTSFEISNCKNFLQFFKSFLQNFSRFVLHNDDTDSFEYPCPGPDWSQGYALIRDFQSAQPGLAVEAVPLSELWSKRSKLKVDVRIYVEFKWNSNIEDFVQFRTLTIRNTCRLLQNLRNFPQSFPQIFYVNKL
jgi:hypothetical protein